MSGLPTNAWYPVARAHDVAPGPVAAQLLGTPLALFRGPSGVVVLQDRCPHRCAALSDGRVSDGTLQCGYHGWRFDDAGSCVQVPGLVDLPPTSSRAATVVPSRCEGGLVWVWAGKRAPSAQLPGRTGIEGKTATFEMDSAAQGDLVDAIENLLDPLHTHFVHPGSVRTEGRRAPIEVVVRAHQDGVEAHYAPEPRERGRIMRLFGGGVGTSQGRYRWPCVAELVYDDMNGKPRFTVHAAFSPVNDQDLRIFATVTGRTEGLPAGLAVPVLRRMFKAVVMQDADVVQRQQRNRKRWPDHVDQSTEGDLLRGPIQRLLREGPGVSLRERNVTLWL